MSDVETRAHESPDLPVKRTLAATGASITVLGLLLGAAAATLRALGGARPETHTLPPEPRLESDPGAQLRDLRKRENAMLSGYAWIDRDAGRVRIPIERAMDLVVERARRR